MSEPPEPKYTVIKVGENELVSQHHQAPKVTERWHNVYLFGFVVSFIAFVLLGVIFIAIEVASNTDADSHMLTTQRGSPMYWKGCYMASCGCPPAFEHSWCSTVTGTGSTYAWISRSSTEGAFCQVNEGNCESSACSGTWCAASGMEAPPFELRHTSGGGPFDGGNSIRVQPVASNDVLTDEETHSGSCRNTLCGCPVDGIFPSGATWCDETNSILDGEWCAQNALQCESDCNGIWCASSGGSSVVTTPQSPPTPSPPGPTGYYPMGCYISQCGVPVESGGSFTFPGKPEYCHEIAPNTHLPKAIMDPRGSPYCYDKIKCEAECNGHWSDKSMGVAPPPIPPSPPPPPSPPCPPRGEYMMHSGFVTRYWDCCKPSCSWWPNLPTFGHAAPIEFCDINDKPLPADPVDMITFSSSSCDGGTAFTCNKQAPFPSPTDPNLYYVFGAAPATDIKAACGMCYEIIFTGTGHFDPKDAPPDIGSSMLLQEKKRLILAVSNVGTDVVGGQFDLMVPGGGIGAFDKGCARQWGVPKQELGEEYGGFRETCRKQTDGTTYATQMDKYNAIKTCVLGMCETIFGPSSTKYPNADLYEACTWYVNWYNMADNPDMTYRIVTCPFELQQAAGPLGPNVGEPLRTRPEEFGRSGPDDPLLNCL